MPPSCWIRELCWANICRILAYGWLTPPGDHLNATLLEKGTSQLRAMLTSKSPHLIWTFCCDRTINGTHPRDEAVQSRWLHKITSCLDTDRRAALSPRYSITFQDEEHMAMLPRKQPNATNSPCPYRGCVVVYGSPHILPTCRTCVRAFSLGPGILGSPP